MTTISIKCTYQTSENPRGAHKLVPTRFSVELTLNDDGTIASWEVDDRTAASTLISQSMTKALSV